MSHPPRVLPFVLAAATVLLASSCSLPERGGSAAVVTVGVGAVYQRERFITDRFQDADWLRRQLDSDAYEQGEQARLFTASVAQTRLALSALFAAGGTLADPAAAAAAQAIEDAGAAADVDVDGASNATSNAGVVTDTGTASTSKPSYTIDPKSLMFAQAMSTLDPDTAAKVLQERPVRNGVIPTPLERLSQKLAFRDGVRAAIRQRHLDDIHDRSGFALYEVQFELSLLPGRNSGHPILVEITAEAEKDCKGPSTAVAEQLIQTAHARSVALAQRINTRTHTTLEGETAETARERAMTAATLLDLGELTEWLMLRAAKQMDVDELVRASRSRLDPDKEARLLRDYVALQEEFRADTDIWSAWAAVHSDKPSTPGARRALHRSAAAGAISSQSESSALREAIFGPWGVDARLADLARGLERVEVYLERAHELRDKSTNGGTMEVLAPDSPGGGPEGFSPAIPPIPVPGTRTAQATRAADPIPPWRRPPPTRSEAVHRQCVELAAAIAVAETFHRRFEDLLELHLDVRRIRALLASADGTMRPPLHAKKDSPCVSALPLPNVECRVIGVSPRMATEQMSSVQRSLVSTALALAAAGRVSAQAGAGLDAQRAIERLTEYESVKQMPVLVGTMGERGAEGKGDATFGWLVYPPIETYPTVLGGTRQRHRYEPIMHSVTATLLVPVASTEVIFTVRHHELTKPWYRCRRPSDAREIRLALPPNPSAIANTLLGGDADSTAPRVLVAGHTFGVKPDEAIWNVRVGQPAAFAIQGVNLWRNPEVFIGGQKADSVDLFADLNGIHVKFNSIQPAFSPDGKAVRRELVVATSAGTDILAGAVAIHPASKGDFERVSATLVEKAIVARDGARLTLRFEDAYPASLPHPRLRLVHAGTERTIDFSRGSFSADRKELSMEASALADPSKVVRTYEGLIDVPGSGPFAVQKVNKQPIALTVFGEDTLRDFTSPGTPVPTRSHAGNLVVREGTTLVFRSKAIQRGDLLTLLPTLAAVPAPRLPVRVDGREAAGWAARLRAGEPRDVVVFEVEVPRGFEFLRKARAAQDGAALSLRIGDHTLDLGTVHFDVAGG